MNADLKKLIRLQAVDLAIDEHRARTDAFPAKSRALDDKLASANDGVERAKSDIRESQAQRKDHEARVADVEARVSKYREQLMSVRTNEEYRAMNKEIEFGRKTIEKEEDRILSIMEEADVLAAALKSAEAVLARDRELVAAERRDLEELNARDLATLEAYRDERKTLASGIDPGVIRHYEHVRRARGGVAIAQAADETCVVCNVRMRPQRFQDVRQNDAIIPCDSCGRILYDPENMDHPFEVA